MQDFEYLKGLVMNNSNTLKIESYFSQSRFEEVVLNKNKIRLSQIRRRRRLIVFDIFLRFTILLLFGILIYMSLENLSTKFTLIQKDREIRKLETVLENKRNENKKLEDNIKNSIDSDYIKSVAVTRYSMFTPSERDIIYFDKSNTEFVRQYDNIR